MIHRLFIVLLLLPISVLGQIINPEINGVTLAPLTTTGKKVDSDSFFINEWCEGSVVVNTNSKEIYIPKLKYDIAEDRLLFQNQQGIFEFPRGSVLKFTLNVLNEKTNRFQKHTFIAGLEGFEKYTPANFFEIIYDGNKIKFLRKTYAELRKSVTSSYGSHTEEYVYVRLEDFYVYKGNKAFLIKKNKKSILEVLGGEIKLWEDFIRTNNLNLKKDDDIIALLKYYETKI